MEELPERHPWLYEKFLEGKHAVTRTGNDWTSVPTDMTIEETLMRTVKSSGGLTRGRGFDESVRNLWVLSLSHCDQLDRAVKDFAGLNVQSDTGNKELGVTRRARDVEHTNAFYKWLSVRNPFLVEDEHLYSLSSGIVADSNDSVNCERAEEIGQRIQKSFDNKTIDQCCVKRKDLLRPISSLIKIKNGGKVASVKVDNQQVMFNRLILIVIADRVDSLESIFKHELTTTPASLFKGGIMRKTQKSALMKTLLPRHSILLNGNIHTYETTVVDGGALLHRVRWMKDTMFLNVVSAYYQYICKNYRNPTIVFDGYELATTKGQEHLRRVAIPQSSFVTIVPDNLIPYSQERYFSLEKNKKEFIKFLSDYLIEKGVEVINCAGDADSEIVRVALSSAKRNTGTTFVVADDTDIAVMLLYHYNEEMDDIHLCQPIAKHTWSIRSCQTHIVDIKEHLLFIHAWSGCDTTSSIFGKGKAFAVKKLRKSLQLRECSRVITSIESTPKEVGNAAITAFKIFYNSSTRLPLEKIRYHIYAELAGNGVIEPEKLPPTEDTAHYHGLRVHHQIMTWSLLEERITFDPLDWGWEHVDGFLVPTTTRLEIAPQSVKSLIRCKCKLTSKNPCGTKLCICFKYGLPCLPACTGCRGEDCHNTKKCVQQVSDDTDVSNDAASEQPLDNNIFDILNSQFYNESDY